MSRQAVTLIGVCCLTFFAGLGRPAITDSDEAFYAEGAREMAERGDWLTPNFNYIPRFEKPPLYYWLASGLYRIAGVSEAVARAPSALAGVGLVLLAFACARRWYDANTGLLAGLITATSFGYIAMARQALPDLPLAFFVTLTIWAALRALVDQSPGDKEKPGTSRTRRSWAIIAGLAAAGAFLMKGPVGIVLPGIVIMPLLIWQDRFRGLRLRARSADLWFAAFVFLLLVIPWFAGMARAHGIEYLEQFFIGENVERFTTTRYNDIRPVWYYFPILAGGLLPWSPFMLVWIPTLWDALRTRRPLPIIEWRLAVWALAPLIFYSVSVGKQPRYILPILPPLAVLLARTIRLQLAAHSGSRHLFTACAVLAGFFLLVVGGLVYRLQALLLDWTAVAPTAVALAIMLTGLAVAAAGIWRSTWVPGVLVTASILSTLGAYHVILVTSGPAAVERMADMVLAARQADEPYGRHRAFDRNLVFYTQREYVELPTLEAAADFLRSPQRALCVLLAEDLAALEAQGITVRRLGEVLYLNRGNLTMRTLLYPEPKTHLQRVLLVSND